MRRNTYYDPVWQVLCNEEWMALSDVGKAALAEDCRHLHNDTTETGLYDKYSVVKLLYQRIGGRANLKSYVDCLLVSFDPKNISLPPLIGAQNDSEDRGGDV